MRVVVIVDGLPPPTTDGSIDRPTQPTYPPLHPVRRQRRPLPRHRLPGLLLPRRVPRVLRPHQIGAVQQGVACFGAERMREKGRPVGGSSDSMESAPSSSTGARSTFSPPPVASSGDGGNDGGAGGDDRDPSGMASSSRAMSPPPSLIIKPSTAAAQCCRSIGRGGRTIAYCNGDTAYIDHTRTASHSPPQRRSSHSRHPSQAPLPSCLCVVTF